MADFVLSQLTMALSAAVEAPPNTTPAGNFHRFVTTSRAFYIQTAENFDDRGKVGLGTDLPNVRFKGYLNPPTMEIADNLDTFIHAMLMRRACGTTAVTVAGSAGTAGTFTHTFKFAKSIATPLSSTMIWALGGADYAWNGMSVTSFRAEQTRSDVPNFTASLVGTGKVSSTSGLTLNSYVTPTYMSGAETRIYYTVDRGGGAATENLADRASNTQRVTGWNVNVNNNVRTDDRRPGDPRADATTPAKGHYVNRQTVGEREVTGEITITLDSVLQENIDSLGDQIYTDFTIETKGRKFIGTDPSTTVQPSVKFIFPKCYISTDEGVDDNNLAVIRTSITPVYDSVADTNLIVVVVNTTATLV